MPEILQSLAQQCQHPVNRKQHIIWMKSVMAA